MGQQKLPDQEKTSSRHRGKVIKNSSTTVANVGVCLGMERMSTGSVVMGVWVGSMEFAYQLCQRPSQRNFFVNTAHHDIIIKCPHAFSLFITPS